MSRETYVIRDGELVPKHLAAPLHHGKASYRFLPDIAPITLPDGRVLSSRSQVRAYEIERGVRQLGNDWPGSVKPAWWDQWRSGELGKS